MRLGTMVTSLLTLPASKLFHQIAELKWFSLCRADTWFCEALLCIPASRVMSGKQNKIKQKNIPVLPSEPDRTGYRRQKCCTNSFIWMRHSWAVPSVLTAWRGWRPGEHSCLSPTSHHFLPCALKHSFSWSCEQLCPLRTSALCTCKNMFHIIFYAWSISEN